MARNLVGPRWMARSLAGPVQWRQAARKLEKSVFKYHKYCVEDGLSVDTPERLSGVSFFTDRPTDRRPPPDPTAR